MNLNLFREALYAWIHRNVFAVRLPWQLGSLWRSSGAASRRCTTWAAEMALLQGAPLEHEDTRARDAAGDGVLERRGRLRQRTCRREVEREQPLRERRDQPGKPCPVGADVDVGDLHPSFGRRRIAGDRGQAATCRHGLQ